MYEGSPHAYPTIVHDFIFQTACGYWILLDFRKKANNSGMPIKVDFQPKSDVCHHIMNLLLI